MPLMDKLLEDAAFSFVFDNLIKPFPQDNGKIWLVGSFLYNSMLGLKKDSSDLDIAVSYPKEFIGRISNLDAIFTSLIRHDPNPPKPGYKPRPTGGIYPDPSPLPPPRYKPSPPELGYYDHDPSPIDPYFYDAIPFNYDNSDVFVAAACKKGAPFPVFIYQTKDLSRIIDIIPMLHIQEYLARVPLSLQSIAFNPFEERIVGDKGLNSLKNQKIEVNNLEQLELSCKQKNCPPYEYAVKKSPPYFEIDGFD